MRSGAGREANPKTPSGTDPRPAGPESASSSAGAEVVRTPTRSPGLLLGTPREILTRISDGDPLQVRKLVAAHVAREALLCDADRFHLRALVHVSRLARRSPGGLAAMLEESVKRAAADDLRQADSPGRGPDAFETLATPLGFSARAARRASGAFNRCALDDRRACLALLVEGRSLDEVARGAGVSASEVARRARRALESALDVLEERPGRALAPSSEKEPR